MTMLRTTCFLFVVGVFLGSPTLSAQETGRASELRHGGFGGPTIKLTQMDGQFSVMMGGRGGWVINESVVIGGGGYALVNGGSFDDLTDGAGTLEMAYGGLELGYLHRLGDHVDLSFGLMVGAGSVAWEPDGEMGERTDDGFFVLEPESGITLSVTRAIRLGLGVSYRLVQGAELFELEGGDLSGIAGVVSLRFGSF